MSAATAPAPLTVYRDDGPIASALAAPGRRLPVPGALPATAAAAILLAVVAIEGDTASDALTGITLAVAIVLGGLATGRAARSNFRWMVPPAIRLTEYAGLLWLGSLAGNSGVPAAFALIAAMAYRHYDLVYRLRHRGATPPRWLDLAALGWEGRLVLGYVVLLAGVLPTAFFILAGVYAVLFVAESVAAWTGAGARPQSVYEEEEDEGQ
jgi:predicted outer membrane lipoprotein